jgi:hypothetical protein
MRWNARSVFFGILGFAAGATLMFIADPRGGRRRRALARDKAYHLARVAGRQATKKARHMRNRAVGRLARARHEREHGLEAVTGRAA